MAKLSHSAARRLGLIEKKAMPMKARTKKSAGKARICLPEDRRPARLEALRLEIDGKPVPKQSFRTARAGLAGYSEARVKAYAQKVESMAAIAMTGFRPWECPLELEILIYFGVPKSWPKARRAQALCGEMAPTQRPDYDNIAKNIDDAMEGIAYINDSQFVKCTFEKVFAEAAKTVVTVTPRLNQLSSNKLRRTV